MIIRQSKIKEEKDQNVNPISKKKKKKEPKP